MVDWRVVPEFPDYSVNEYGAFMNDRRRKPVKTRLNHQNFLMVGLVKDGRQITRSVAGLVASAFLEAPPYPSYNSVIHLNGDRTDCRSMNLMWRPRWYATRYQKMFDDDPLRVSVYIPELQKAFYSLREFCTTYGLIEKQTYVNLVNGDPCFLYGWRLERHET